MNNIKKEKGITLIALAVTIIVILILAGVTIAALTSENGIVNQATKSRDKMREATAKERVQTEVGGSYNYLGIIDIDLLNTNLKNIKGLTHNEKNIAEEPITSLPAEVELDGYKIKILEEGMTEIVIEEAEEEENSYWTKILEEATKNPEKFRHEEQSSTNGDIGIGTDGKPVNMDLWRYHIFNDNEIALNKWSGCGTLPGYIGNIIDGKIEGKVPQYIKKEGNDKFYLVTNMFQTFRGDSNLEIAPEIPQSVTNLEWTFADCSRLRTAPEISKNVKDIDGIFYKCLCLTGTIIINSKKIENYEGCFDNTFFPITLKGTSSQLNEIANASGSNVTVEQ